MEFAIDGVYEQTQPDEVQVRSAGFIDKARQDFGGISF